MDTESSEEFIQYNIELLRNISNGEKDEYLLAVRGISSQIYDIIKYSKDMVGIK